MSGGPSSEGGYIILGSSAFLLRNDEFIKPREGASPHHVNIPGLVIAGLVFLAVLSWANVIEHFFFTTFPDDPSKIDMNRRYEHTIVLFWYAVLWTCLAIIGSAIIIKYIM